MKSLTDEDGIDGPFERGMSKPPTKPKRTIDDRIAALEAQKAEQIEREKARDRYDMQRPLFRTRDWAQMLRLIDEQRAVVARLAAKEQGDGE